MAEFPFEKLLEPLSDDQPCGPDLDFEGDAEFMGFTARLEGVLPQSFFTFDRASIDFPAEFKAIEAFCERSIDLRLLVPLAKLLILNRDLEGFEKAVVAMRQILADRWESLNPQLLDGDPVMRIITLQTLDDMPHTVFPLQAVPMFRTRRFGPVSYRACLLAEGKLQPRRGSDGDDEKTPSQSDIKTALQEVEIADLVAARDRAGRIAEALAGIEQSMDDLSGQVGQLRFEQLKALAQGMHAFLDANCALRDPALGTLGPKAADAEATDSGGSTPQRSAAAGAIESRAEAQAALRAAITYFARNERSSPIRFLLAQAHHLAGKSFYDALRALLPDHAGYASLRLARDLPFLLPVNRLAELVDEAEAGIELEEPAEEEAGEGDETSTSSADSWGSWNNSNENSETSAEEPDPDAPQASEAEASAESTDEGAASEESREHTDDQGGSEALQSTPKPEKKAKKVFVANTRLEALELIERVAAFVRTTEPSSPVPMLLDQARGNAGRDFLGLLRDALPERVFRVDE